MMKRAFDLLLSSMGLILLSPVLLLLAVWVRLDSPGPVFYRGVRIGKDGKPFRMFKFRSMVPNAELVGGSAAPDDDPRVTRFGRLLRKYKLDELPQLFNVWNGTMSLVGPRPQVAWIVALYSEEEREILSLRPGITDFSSLKFRNQAEIIRGAANPDQAYLESVHPEKMRLSLEYLRTRTLWLDLKILVQTVSALLCGSVQMEAANCTAKPESDF